MGEKQDDIILKVDHLTKTFQVKSPRLFEKPLALNAVNDVSFEVKRGETIGVIGESGCGKSTLGKAILQLIPATSGDVIYNGQSLMKLNQKEMNELRKEINMVFQDPYSSLDPRMTTGELIEEPMIIHNIGTPEERKKRVIELLKLVGLDYYHSIRYPHEFSGGQRQRINIARALSMDIKLLVCDEPVSALDVSVQAQVLNLLQELKEKLGLTYFFISHNLNVVYQVSDRVGVMYLGKMVEIANYDQLYEKRYHPYTEALLSAIPQVDQGEQKERIHLEGEVPSPYDPPSGCHFHTRCPKACDKCRQTAPELKEVAPGHYVACHLYE